MTVQDLYNILETEIDAGRITLESNVYFEYEDICYGSADAYKIKESTLFLHEIMEY